jgi:hypothetical protein
LAGALSVFCRWPDGHPAARPAANIDKVGGTLQ